MNHSEFPACWIHVKQTYPSDNIAKYFKFRRFISTSFTVIESLSFSSFSGTTSSCHSDVIRFDYSKSARDSACKLDFPRQTLSCQHKAKSRKLNVEGVNRSGGSEEPWCSAVWTQRLTAVWPTWLAPTLRHVSAVQTKSLNEENGQTLFPEPVRQSEWLYPFLGVSLAIS